MVQALTIVDKSAIQQLPENLRKYALAKDSQVISKMAVNISVKEIYATLSKVLFDTTGLNQDKSNGNEEAILNISENLYKLICDKYKALTIEELKLAFLNGSLGEYGTYFGINLKTCSDWLKGFLNDENKKMAMAEWNKLIGLVQIKKYSEVEQRQIIFDGCLHFFSEYKEFGKSKALVVPVDRVCAIYYDELEKVGLINFSKEKKNEFSRKAEEIYKSEILQAKLNRNIKKSDYENLMETIGNNSNHSLKNKRRKIALLNYFDDLIEFGESLEKLIKEKV